MDELQNMRLPFGTTGWNHSCYRGIPHSAPHSLQQPHSGASSPHPVQILASTRESHGAATPSSVFCPQVTHSAISPQVRTGPTRTVTSDLMSATLAEAVTHLSFAAFLERCISVSAPPPPPLPIPTPPLDAATQTIPHIAVSQGNSRSRSSLSDVSTRIIPRGPWLHLLRTMFSAPRVPDPSRRYFLTRLCRRLCTASRLTMPPHKLPRTEFFFACIFSNDPLDRQGSSSAHCNAGSASLPQPAGIATFCSPSSASHASDVHEDTTAPRVLPQPPPGLEKYACQHASHCIPVKAAPVRPRLCTSISATFPQLHVSATQVGTNPVRSATTYKRSASTALAGRTILLVQILEQELVLFLSHEPLVLPVVKFGQSKPNGLGHIDTADSDLMHHQYGLSVLQWNPGPASRNPTNIFASACGRFHAVILQEASDHVPHISDQFIAHTGNTDLAILLNKDTFEPDPMVLRSWKIPQAKVLGAWFYSSFEYCCAVPHFPGHQRSHFAQYTFTMSWPRNVRHPLSYFSGFTGT